MKTPFSIPSAGLIMLSVLLAASTLKAEDLQVLKMTGRWSQTPTSYQIGVSTTRNALAISDKWIVAGTAGASEQYTNQGAVQVFNAVTGAWLRKLLPPGPANSVFSFGETCVISGNLAVITGNVASSPRRVFVYDLATGKNLRELTVPGLVFADQFGASLAVSGDKVLVGAYGSNALRGAAYLFSLRTGMMITRLQPADTVANDRFGSSAAIDGSLAVIGAPGASSAKGCAYLYDLQSASLVKKLSPTNALANDNAGVGVAITEGKVLLASYLRADSGRIIVFDIITGSERELTASGGIALSYTMAAHSGIAVASTQSTGTVYVFDLRSSSTTEMGFLNPVDRPSTFMRLGLAIHQGAVIATGQLDNTLASGSGAVYLYRTLTRTLPMTKVAARGDFAPGAPETTYKTLGDAFINADAEVAYTSTLTGSGSNAGKDNGLWSTLAPAGSLDLVLKSRDTVVSSNVVSVSRPLINRPSTALYHVKRSGVGITSQNNQLLMREDGTTTSVLAQNPFGSPDKGILQLVQSSFNDLAAYTLTLRTGFSGITAVNDSGLVLINPITQAIETEKEGDPIASSTLNYGQFTNRVAMYTDTAFYATAVTGDPPINQAILRKTSGSNESVVAKKFDLATGAVALYSSFLGETMDDLGTGLFRAKLTSPATSANNEGLWTHSSGGTTTLVMRKGDVIGPLNGLKIARFINFWVSNGQTLALVTLSGSGVTAANDQALLLYQNTPGLIGTILVLMREGDPAPGCHPATIGTISRVEVETYYGQYLVLATLAGAPAGANQCLFRGATRKDALTPDEQYLRRPVAILRKGERFTDRTSKLKSISLPTTNLTAGGAGSTGLGYAMRHTNGAVLPNTIVLTLEFENGVRQIMKGIP